MFLSGLGSAAQIALSNATQATLNSTLNQPQSLTFAHRRITANATLYVANSGAARIDTLSSTGGGLTHWNRTHTGNLVYPSDVSFDSLGDLVVSDATAAKVFSFNPALAESTVNTGSYQLSECLLRPELTLAATSTSLMAAVPRASSRFPGKRSHRIPQAF